MSIFSLLIPLALVAVGVALVIGIFSMVKGGEFNDKYGNALMRWRVALQAIAVGLIVLSLVLGKE